MYTHTLEPNVRKRIVTVLTLSLVSVTVDTVLGVATVELETEAVEEVKVDLLVDEPRLRSRALPSVPSP